MKPSGHGLRNLLVLVGLSTLALTGCGSEVPVLDPQGPVARQELNLIIWSFALMMLVVIAVFVIYTVVIVKNRARPENKDYQPPDEHGNRKLETIWTVIPVLIVIALAIPTIATTYKLVQPPKSNADPITIDVTSADWKWIFSYPDQGIETVNEVYIPAGHAVNFELTSVDAMNSFWVPSLGGQEFTMSGKELKLWLQADKPGDYSGRSANFSGEGFAHMTFTVHALTTQQFDQKVKDIKATKPALTKAEYSDLMKPSVIKDPLEFSTNTPVTSTP